MRDALEKSIFVDEEELAKRIRDKKDYGEAIAELYKLIDELNKETERMNKFMEVLNEETDRIIANLN